MMMMSTFFRPIIKRMSQNDRGSENLTIEGFGSVLMRIENLVAQKPQHFLRVQHLLLDRLTDLGLQQIIRKLIEWVFVKAVQNLTFAQEFRRRPG